jgi:simple sugar transport system permease protein
VLFTGIFVSYITNGGFYMQLYDFVPEIIDIIISIIIYFSALALIVRHFFDRYTLKAGVGDDDIPAPRTTKPKRRAGKVNEEVDKDE